MSETRDPLTDLLVEHVPEEAVLMGLELDARHDSDLKAWLRLMPEHLRRRLYKLIQEKSARDVDLALRMMK